MDEHKAVNAHLSCLGKRAAREAWHPITQLRGKREWSEPILPDTEGSQLPGTGRERASNSTGGRYPKLECRLLVFYTSSMKTAKFASASAKDSSSLR